MPAKKTTTGSRSTAGKKPAAKKTVAAKKPTATVVEKKVATNKTKSCSPCSSLVPTILLAINTILLVVLIFGIKSMVNNSLENFEAQRIGGAENHELMKKIYNMDAYKQDQKMRLEQTIASFKNLGNQGIPNNQGMPQEMEIEVEPEMEQ